MLKVLTVFGTRPEAIKMCPLVLELQKRQNIECSVCLTGQHREMLDSIMKVFRVSADFDLNIMSHGQTLSMITCKVLEKMNEVIEKVQPDLILVHGDTTSSFAVALSAFYQGIPIGHVEAGLRTFNMYSPYPEEFNRQVVDLISSLYFAPTETAKRQLLEEGKNEKQIYVTGNTGIDALETTVVVDYESECLKWAEDSKLILLTTHRRENIGQSMENIFRALKKILDAFPEVKVVYPIHKNPKVRELAYPILEEHSRIRIIEPLDVVDFHNLMARCYLILTDSGGIQEEATALGVPALVLRDTTERPEGIEAGTLKLVGTGYDTIYSETVKLLENQDEYYAMKNSSNLYGNGDASRKIANIIEEYFELS